jgi:hypothetical protein
MMTDSYISKDSEVAPQLRLLIDNRYTLNPYSNLVVKRWDLNDKERVAKYEAEMRKYIRNLKTDSKKVKEYKAKLEW